MICSQIEIKATLHCLVSDFIEGGEMRNVTVYIGPMSHALSSENTEKAPQLDGANGHHYANEE